jgi:cephalosporin hydroxylase
MTNFSLEVKNRIEKNSTNETLKATAKNFLLSSIAAQYSYNFSWLSRPIIQYPQDMIAVQELVMKVKPDLIIETGIAHGGSLILSASMLAMLDYIEAANKGTTLNPSTSKRRVIGIDIDIREHNRKAINEHPLSHLIQMFEGSSISSNIIEQVHTETKKYQKIMVMLDSNHTHDHVLQELELYAPLVSKESYCIVFDTVVEDLPQDQYNNRPWGPGDNPKTATWKYLDLLKTEGRFDSDGHPLHFSIDEEIENKILLTVAPQGYLKRI